jgi:hypothetical protein
MLTGFTRAIRKLQEVVSSEEVKALKIDGRSYIKKKQSSNIQKQILWDQPGDLFQTKKRTS